MKSNVADSQKSELAEFLRVQLRIMIGFLVRLGVLALWRFGFADDGAVFWVQY